MAPPHRMVVIKPLRSERQLGPFPCSHGVSPEDDRHRVANLHRILTHRAGRAPTMKGPMRPPLSLVRRSWWWVFGLFIATPAVALALLGLERDSRRRDRAATAAARRAGPGRQTCRCRARDRLDRESARDDALRFEVDGRGVVSFPDDRVYDGPFGAGPIARLST